MEEVVVNPTFWRGRRVFLTGHTGFKGGWLSLWLQSLGAEVHGYALAPPTQPNLFEVARVAEGMASSTIADIRDPAALTRAVERVRPEVVFHLAAQPLVRHSYAAPVETYSTNIMGTVNLLESVRATPGIRAVVNVTTDKCYENREWLWGYRENEPLGGGDPYSSSKACAELVTAAYRRSFLDEAGVAVASARAGNVIGGGDWAVDRLVPDILRAFLDGHDVHIRNPTAVRPWQHVVEPLCGYLMLAERLCEVGVAYAEAWNFGPSSGDACTVEWIVRQMVSCWGSEAGWRASPGQHPHEAAVLRLDISKARSRLHWNPRWGLNEALRHTVAWQREWLGGKDMRVTCLKQIANYDATPPLAPTPSTSTTGACP